MDNGFQVKEKNSDSVVFIAEFIGNLPFIVETKESAHISASNMSIPFGMNHLDTKAHDPFNIKTTMSVVVNSYRNQLTFTMMLALKPNPLVQNPNRRTLIPLHPSNSYTLIYRVG